MSVHSDDLLNLRYLDVVVNAQKDRQTEGQTKILTERIQQDSYCQLWGGYD